MMMPTPHDLRVSARNLPYELKAMLKDAVYFTVEAGELTVHCTR